MSKLVWTLVPSEYSPPSHGTADSPESELAPSSQRAKTTVHIYRAKVAKGYLYATNIMAVGTSLCFVPD